MDSQDNDAVPQHSNKRWKKKATSRRSWTDKEQQVLIEALKEIVNLGMKTDNAFRSGYLNVLYDKMLIAFPGTDLRPTPHIDSKIKVWKRIYTAVDRMRTLSGFGWNDIHKSITCDDDAVWEAHVKVDPNAHGLRDKSLPFYEDWCIVFGKDRATGEFAEGPAEAMAAMENEVETNDIESENIGKQPTSGSVHARTSDVEEGRPSKRNKSEPLMTCMKEMNATMREFFTMKRVQVCEMISRLPLDPVDKIDATIAITAKAQFVDIFTSLNDDADRLLFIKRLSRMGG
ncbi:uncharacterized protein At2g29880-like [Impatiens glandulifera]|uniref:uncharacterized protein At2g29880-like n=1 Tax=Impatiens glandulifera TaxID=253017 RepID=UPI001FB19D0D|nr:uncharacterized protein At2g29880-like [Impatiens glandulifera]